MILTILSLVRSLSTWVLSSGSEKIDMEILRQYAMQFVGTPYKWGGDDPIDGFDCSGFIQELLASVGVDPQGDQTAQKLFDHFEKYGQWNIYKCGALAFYGKSVAEITHVAMMIDTYRIIEAGGGGSKTKSKQDAADQNAYVRVRLLRNRKDLVAVILPRYSTIDQI